MRATVCDRYLVMYSFGVNTYRTRRIIASALTMVNVGVCGVPVVRFAV